MADEETCTIEVFRYQPPRSENESEKDGENRGGEPRFDRYEVPFRKEWVVLDALNHIKDRLDGTLTYRWSCRMGVCGSCGMMVNGTPRLTCATFLKEFHPAPVRVEPLANFPVVRDLVVDIDDFMRKLSEVKAWMIPKEKRSVDQGEYLQSPAELATYKQFSMCINCMLCYAACPVYGLEPKFIGPAAIALAQRYNLDSRDGGGRERAEVVASNEGIWECTLVGECTTVCPKKVDPAGAIQQAKIAATKDYFTGFLMPRGTRP